MSTETIDVFYAAKIRLKKRRAPYDVLDVWASSRESFDDNGIFIPILKSISGLGQTVGQDVPLPVNGSIMLDDSWGSLSAKRKFSDLLERYTLTEQPIEIYYSLSELDTFDFESGLTLLFKGKMKEGTSNPTGQPSTFTISVEGTNIEDRYMTKAIDGDYFTSAPEASLGKNIPLVLGGPVEVDPIKVSPDPTDEETPSYLEFAWGTTLGTTHVNGGINGVKLKDHNGNYKLMNSPMSEDTPVFQSAGTPTVAWQFYDLDSDHSGRQDDVCIPLDFADTFTNYVITGGALSVRGALGGGWTTDSEIIIEIYERRPKNKKGPMREPIATAEVDKNEYLANFRSTTSFDIEFRFDKPIFLSNPNGYCINFTQTLNDDESDEIALSCINSATPYFRRGHYVGTTKRPNRWQFRATGAPANKTPCWKLYGMRWSPSAGPFDADINEEGLGHQTIGFLQHNFTGDPMDEQPVCDLSSLDPIFMAYGLQDDIDGTITGVPYKLLENPQQILQAVTKKWNGTEWVSNTDDYDFSVFTEQAEMSRNPYSLFSVNLRGKSEGAQSLTQLLQNILKNSTGRLVTRNNGKMAFYFYGVRSPETFEFTDDNSYLMSFKELNSSSIVNRVQIFSNKLLSTITARRLATEQSFKNFGNALDWTYNTNGYAEVVSTDSYNVFGLRTLNSKGTSYDLVSWDTAMAIAYYLLTLFNFPHRTITIRTTFAEAAGIELLDVGTIQSVSVPCFFGTDPERKIPTFEGAPVDYLRGSDWRRAKRYRVQVVQKDNDLSERDAPTVVLTLKIITTELGDMT